jgi:hypothetical protein
MDWLYAEYDDCTKAICNSGNLSNFKSSQKFVFMLEHVPQDQGGQYYECLKPIFSNNIITAFCNKNDSIGSPIKHYINGLNSNVSPSSLRYLYHAYLSLKHIQTLNLSSIDIVEVGCGYGGLCLAIDYVSNNMNININSYACIDLENPLRLQQRYIETVGTHFPVRFHSAFTFGSDISGTNNFLISNYCFSEIGDENRQKYIEILIPKVSHGFMTWNAIPLFNFGKEFIKVEDENPQTGPAHCRNSYVYF